MSDLTDTICDAIASEFEIAGPQVRPEARLREDLDLDSLDIVALGTRVEETFDVLIEDDELAALDCVADVVRMVERHLPNRAG